jgi:hypothetical protein
MVVNSFKPKGKLGKIFLKQWYQRVGMSVATMLLINVGKVIPWIDLGAMPAWVSILFCSSNLGLGQPRDVHKLLVPSGH